MLGRTLDPIISLRGYNYPWGNVLPAMRDTDVNIINLETTLTKSDLKRKKTFNFKASPDKVTSLTNAKITVANLANNHILDFSTEGLLETVDTLDRAGITHVGAGKNRKEAVAPVIINKKGVAVGVLGFTDNEPEWKAGSGPGTRYMDIENEEEYRNLLDSIRHLRTKCDIVVVSVHWGPNMRERPSNQFIALAHLMSENGAHVIHGHSAHILQGIEYFNRTLILYDTGDFVDDYAVDAYLRNDLSAFFILNVDKSGLLNLRILPTRIRQYQVNEATNADRIWVLNRIQQLSSAFDTHIDAEGNLDLRSVVSQ